MGLGVGLGVGVGVGSGVGLGVGAGVVGSGMAVTSTGSVGGVPCGLKEQPAQRAVRQAASKRQARACFIELVLNSSIGSLWMYF